LRKITSAQVIETFHHVLTSFEDDERFCRESLTVLNERGQRVPMIWRPAQHKLHAAIARQVERKQPVRAIILKARQVGFSTATAGCFFKRTPFIDGQHTLVVAHQGDAATNLFGYYQGFQENYVPFMGVLELPDLVTDIDGKLEWDNESLIQIATANNLKVGRSFTFRRVHLSEYAFYRDAKRLMTGLIQAVPDDPDTMVIIESTANGLGGPFFDKWEEANDPAKHSAYVPIFFAWFEEPRYQMALGMAPDVFQSTLTDDVEWELKQKHNLTLEQLQWRRWAITNKCEGDPRVFKQEYPSTAEEAFLVSGRPRFDPVFFSWMPELDPQIGGLVTHRLGTKEVLRFEPREHGELSLYKKPQEYREYIIGGDTADGQDANEGGGTADPDYSVGQVLERDMGEQVAMLRERLEPVAFGYYLYELGRWYNWAYQVIEVGGSTYGAGLATVNELIRLGYPIDRIYHRRTTDESTQRVLHKIGWMTKPNTRPMLISALDRSLMERELILHDKVTIRECHSFVIKANGKAEAQQGCHDDTVIALALAEIGILQAPRQARLLPQDRKQPKKYGETAREQTRGTMYYGRGRGRGRR
jgi:hypothetical protein